MPAAAASLQAVPPDQDSPPFLPASAPLSRPAEASTDTGRNSISRLQRSAVFRDYQKAFENSTGLPLALRHAGSFQFPLQGSRQANAFCTLMAGSSKTCVACLQLQQRVEQKAVFAPRTMRCFAGLHESAVPVRVGDRVLGYLQTGQVLLRPPTEAGLRALHRRLAGMSRNIALPRLRKTYFRTRVMSRRQYDSVVRLLGFFAQHLAGLSNQLIMQAAPEESGVIAHARSYMAEHHAEDLSLQLVARMSNCSRFYFCKLFKKDTGLTFTDYLARIRISSAKRQLLNPSLRISEIAFATGFLCLSQFNRAYRRIEGESPSVFRGRLHQQPAPAVRGYARSA